MNILIDIGHPAHVHLFRNFTSEMIKRGHSVLFTVRDKEMAIYLVNHYGINHLIIGQSQKGAIRKLIGMVRFDIKLYRAARKFRAELFLSHGSIYASHAAFLTGRKHIALEDTGNPEQVMLYKPFTDCILTPSTFPLKYGRKQVKHNSYHELAYLHPKYYQPDEGVFELLGNPGRENYVLLRFVSFNASHDIFREGLDLELKHKIINHLLEKKLRIYISSEDINTNEFSDYQLKTPPEKIFDVMYFAELLIADSQTMTAEAGILGTPAIRCNDLVGTSHGYHHRELEEKFGLISNFHPRDEISLFKRIDEILDTSEKMNIQKDRKNTMLKEKSNLTEELINLVEKYS